MPGLPCESETSAFTNKKLSLETGVGELSFTIRDEHSNSYDQQDVQEPESKVDLDVRVEASAPLTCTIRTGPAPGRGTVALQLDAEMFIEHFPGPLSLRLFCRHPTASKEIVAASVPVKVLMPRQPLKHYVDLAMKRMRRIKEEYREVRRQLLNGNEEVEEMKNQADLDNNQGLQKELTDRKEQCLALQSKGKILRKIWEDLENKFRYIISIVTL